MTGRLELLIAWSISFDAIERISPIPPQAKFIRKRDRSQSSQFTPKVPASSSTNMISGIIERLNIKKK